MNGLNRTKGRKGKQMNQPDTCQICKQDFTDTDRVVVCPYCGAPYHKECYDKEGHCAYESRHAAGYEYQSAAKKTEAYTAKHGVQQDGPVNGGAAATQAQTSQVGKQSGAGKLCAHCQTINTSSNIFCESCGKPLHQTAGGHNTTQTPFGTMPTFMPGGFAVQMPNMDLHGEYDGLSKRNWAAFIGQSVPVYFMRMSQQDQRKSKLSFTISAFFFSYFYFAYRKMWLWAAIALLLELVFLVPGFLAIYMDAGVPFMQGVSAELMIQLQNVSYVLGLVRNVAFGVFALHLYRKHAGEKIRQLQKSTQENQNLPLLLSQKGGVSVLGVVAVLAVMFIVSTVWVLAGGDEIMSYMMSMMNMAAP